MNFWADQQTAVELAHVVGHTQRHRPVWSGLELEHDVDIEQSALTGAHLPDHVVLALLQAVADVASRDLLQGGHVEKVTYGTLGEA